MRYLNLLKGLILDRKKVAGFNNNFMKKVGILILEDDLETLVALLKKGEKGVKGMKGRDPSASSG
jgi:hypothetical protein